MKIKFTVDYRTQWGQFICIGGSSAKLGQWQEEAVIPMHLTSGEQWQVEIDVPEEDLTNLGYKYLIKDESGYVAWEFGEQRLLQIDEHFVSAQVRDFWRPANAHENALYTSPFSKAFFIRTPQEKPEQLYGTKQTYVRMQIRAPRISKDYHLGIIGSGEALGHWDQERVHLLNDEDFPVWKTDLPIHAENVPFEYKYVIYSHRDKRVVTIEHGANRYFPLHSLKDPTKLIVHTDEFFSYPVGNWKAAGVAIPVFSLRSEQGSGVGELTDIKGLVDWAVTTGMKVVQVLPVNDTVATHTWTDSYPYAAISVEAIHPIYANLKSIGVLKDDKKQQAVEKEAAKLNALSEVDYEGVMKLKSKFFKYAFDEQQSEFLKSKAFQKFYEANTSWLPDYAAFSYLRDRFGTPDFTQWGEYAQMSDEDMAAFVAPGQPHYNDIAIHYFIQFHLDAQLLEASAYARQRGVVLKGDIPIGIYRNSVDAWRLPHLFHMDCQAGAPPDDFSISGQNWGFPTYNWEEMVKDGFHWWKERMVKMSEYFDVFRIDHILGFFRIWEIGWEHVEGIMGRFNPALPFGREELAQWGIHFDQDRFCRPYIREYMIYDLFGNHAESVFTDFLEEYAPGCYELKPAYDSQRKIKIHYDALNQADPEAADFNNWMRYNLYRLHAEVLFMEAPLSGGEAFNPRISFHSTYSYQALDADQRSKLNALYTHYFYKRHNDFWRESAMLKLPMLKAATDMLICGEDLGMVPASVPGVMDELQILSLAIQRMPNDDRGFWNPADTPYLSVTSTGSHDMSTLREWWEEDHETTQRFYNQILGHGGEAPYFCEPWLAKDIIKQHLHSPSMLAIFPIQDLLAMDGQLRREHPEEERINVPSNPTHYWRYRLHLSTEQLMHEDGFNGFLRQLVDQGGRSADY